MEYNEWFRMEFLSKMKHHVDRTTLNIMDDTIISLLSGKTINADKDELMVVGDFNSIMLEHYYTNMQMCGKSDSTIKAYKLSVDAFRSYCSKDFREVTSNDIRCFLVYYKEVRHPSDRTLENMRQNLNAVFRFFAEKEIIRKNPVAMVDKIKYEKKVLVSFSKEELEALRCACADKRERAILEFLIGTGCRVSEVANFKVGDVDFVNKEAIVTKAKCKKQRKIFPTETCLYHLKEYLNTRPNLKADDPLLLNSFSKNGKELSKHVIEDFCRRLAVRANVQECHPHKFRRTYVTNNLIQGVPIQSVCKVAGHESINTTMMYYAGTDAITKSDIRKVG